LGRPVGRPLPSLTDPVRPHVALTEAAQVPPLRHATWVRPCLRRPRA